MKYIFTSFITLLVTSHLICQNLSFEEGQTILEFPEENLGLKSPVLPLDYNADGITDFFRISNELIIYKGLGDGEYEEIENSLTQNNPLRALDFDQDGDLDVIMSRYIAINESNDLFSKFSLQIAGVIIEAADFDGDGLIDLLTHTNEDNIFADQELIVNYNQGDGSFISEVISSGLLYGDVDLGDLDNDGDTDIVALDYLEDFPFLIFTNEGSSFTARKTNHSVTVSNSNLYLIDIDNDSDLDIITNNRNEGLWMIENNEDLLLDDVLIYHSTPQIIYFNHADLNNDGNEDIVFWGGNNSNTINIYALEGKGNFDFEDRLVVGAFDRPPGFSYPNGNYLANNCNLFDYDNDGKMDIIYTDGFSEMNKLVVFNNTTIISGIHEEQENPNLFTVYPNPVKKILYLESNYSEIDKTNYEIISIDGSVLRKGQIQNNSISVEDLENGIYYLKVGKLTEYIKIIKI